MDGGVIVGIVLFLLIVVLPIYGILNGIFNFDHKKSSDRECRRLAELYRSGQPYIKNLPTTQKEKTKLEIELKRITNRLLLDKMKLQEDFQKGNFSKGKRLNAMVEYDDAMQLLNDTYARLKRNDTTLGNDSNVGNHSSNRGNKSDNVRKSKPQQQPDWKKPSNNQSNSYGSTSQQSSNHSQQPNWKKPSEQSKSDREAIVSSFINCGYSRSEAEEEVSDLGTHEAKIKLPSIVLEVLQRKYGLSESEAKNLIILEGIFGAIPSLQKKFPPLSNS